MQKHKTPDDLRSELETLREMRDDGRLTVQQFNLRSARLLKQLERMMARKQRYALT